VFAIEIKYGQKISQHFACKVLGLPTDDKLARSPRNKFRRSWVLSVFCCCVISAKGAVSLKAWGNAPGTQIVQIKR
jgi:hypothetical protein